RWEQIMKKASGKENMKIVIQYHPMLHEKPIVKQVLSEGQATQWAKTISKKHPNTLIILETEGVRKRWVPGDPAFGKGQWKDFRKTAMAATFVEITREMLEDWLDTLKSHLFEKWYLKPGYQGVYYLPLSTTVAVKLSSTVGGKNVVVEVGKGSMQLALVSRITGQVINKKAQGQGYFARTTNWQKTWKEGILRMIDAYNKAQGFYDALAGITDRAKYKKDILTRIQSIEEWQEDQRLSDWYRRVFADGILTEAQIAYIEEKAKEVKPAAPEIDEKLLNVLKEIWKKAKGSGDDYTMSFCKDVAEKRVKNGLPLSVGQKGYLDRMRQKYRV
ncbi:MAG: hypothetical protein WC824_14170, partial [Bacteroidota bacterium]